MPLADWPLTEADAADLAARQVAFERLEWLGDSLLDLVTARRIVRRDRRTTLPSLAWHEAQRLATVSDRALGRAAARAGLGHGTRGADLVEALGAGVWRAGGWPALEAFADRVVLARLRDRPFRPWRGPAASASTTRVLVDAGWSDPDPVLVGIATGGRTHRRRRLAWLGGAGLEAAAAIRLFDQRPGADEGELSAARANRLERARIVERARAGALAPVLGHDGPEATLDRARAVVGAAALAGGPAAAVELADPLVR